MRTHVQRTLCAAVTASCSRLVGRRRGTEAGMCTAGNSRLDDVGIHTLHTYIVVVERTD